MPEPDHEAQEVIEISSDSESDSSEDALNAPLRALNYASRSHLHNAIATLPEARVRQAFSALIDTLPSMSERVFQMLLAEQRLPIIQRGSQAELDEQDASDDEEEEAAELYPHQKILIPRWAVCANCGDDFDVGQEREDGECKYHSGDLEVNEEAFVDWDEDCHGPMDTSENRRQWPENFTWSCCEEDGTAEGCEVGEHEPEQAQDRRKRARYQ